MGLGNYLTADKPGTGLLESLSPGAYLTDGINLFRVASVTSGSDGPKVVELEDCRTLEASVYDSEAVMKLGLVAVTPAPNGCS